MKKICLVLLLFLTACSSVPKFDTEFKNPVFNQPLRPLSRGTGYVYLTPTSVDFRTPLDKDKIDTQGKCDLIENEQDHITLQCQVEGWGRTYNKYFTYEVKELFLPRCLNIVEYSYSTLEDFPKFASYATYCVTPPKKMLSESD